MKVGKRASGCCSAGLFLIGGKFEPFPRRVCSLAEETPVTTDEGPISGVAIGDHVLAWNELIEATGYYTVTAVWPHEDPVVVELTIDGELIETTPECPFWSADEAWVAAGELVVGDKVVDADSGLVELVVYVPAVM